MQKKTIKVVMYFNVHEIITNRTWIEKPTLINFFSSFFFFWFMFIKNDDSEEYRSVNICTKQRIIPPEALFNITYFLSV